MSILEIMYVKLFNFQCSVCVSKDFFAAFAAPKIPKGKGELFLNCLERQPKNISIT